MKYSLTYGPKKRFFAFVLECIGFFICKPLAILTGRGKKDSPNILIIEPFQMGDIIALSAIFGPLRKKYPLARFYILGKKGPVQIARLLTDVEDILFADFPWSTKGNESGSWLLWFQQMRAFRRYGFSLGIDVRGDVRSHLSLILAGCRSILSFRQYIYSDIQNHGMLADYQVNECRFRHVFDRNRFLLTGLGIPETELFPVSFPLFTIKEGGGRNQEKKTRSILLHVGASWLYKMWPLEHWAGLIRQFQDEGIGPVIVVAGPGEEHIVEGIRNLLPKEDMPEVRFPTLPELIALLQNASLLIGCDSGPMCIANALDIPRIALFGPGIPEVWKPYSDSSVFLQDVAGYDCYPCILKECVRPDSPCIAQITTKHVSDQAKRIVGTV